jgi:hypothetical protein
MVGFAGNPSVWQRNALPSSSQGISVKAKLIQTREAASAWASLASFVQQKSEHAHGHVVLGTYPIGYAPQTHNMVNTNIKSQPLDK